MNFIDYAIIIIIILGAINGYRNGLIQSVVGLAGNLLALYLAIKYRKPFGDLLDTKFGLAQSLKDFLTYNLPMPIPVTTHQIDQLPYANIIKYINDMGLPEVIKNQLIFYIDKITLSIGNTGVFSLGELFIQLITSSLVYGISLLLIWVAVDKLLTIIAAVITKAMGQGVFGSLNRGLGILVGVSISLISLTVIIGVLSPLISIGSVAEKSVLSAFSKTISESQTVPYFISIWNILLGKIVTFF